MGTKPADEEQAELREAAQQSAILAARETDDNDVIIATWAVDIHIIARPAFECGDSSEKEQLW